MLRAARRKKTCSAAVASIQECLPASPSALPFGFRSCVRCSSFQITRRGDLLKQIRSKKTVEIIWLLLIAEYANTG